MFEISRRYTFAAAHRIEGHPKCGRLHGHNYSVTVVLKGELVDGMVMDYGHMDEVIKPMIDAFDHRYLVSYANEEAQDPYAAIAMRNGDGLKLRLEHSTAEQLAEYFHWDIQDTFSVKFPGIKVLSVQVDETEKSMAKYVAED